MILYFITQRGEKFEMLLVFSYCCPIQIHSEWTDAGISSAAHSRKGH